MNRWLFVPLLLAVGSLFAVPPEAEKAAKQTAVEVGDAARRAQVEKGMTVTPWAAEPALVNPVAFAFDHQGACFVVETNRFSDGVPDTRGFMYWLDDDIGARSVEDRLAMYAKHKYPAYEKYGETIRKVWGLHRQGRRGPINAVRRPFNKPADGVGAGVLARNGEVFFTCIPSLYKFKDTKNAGTADVTEILSTGYGIHVQFVGHDLHGLRTGPDGKLYFSIGDRGTSTSPRVDKNDTSITAGLEGAVFRCDWDGTKNMEIVHRRTAQPAGNGLRRPTATCSLTTTTRDSWRQSPLGADRGRWRTRGWRCGYQYGTLMNHPGGAAGQPWPVEHREDLAHCHTREQAAGVCRCRRCCPLRQRPRPA